ncbi:MAG: MarR family transcriptional regulator [Lawsonibacter sp.]|nr:MarR family transcriptional regulator [Lawsonibacter sp.]
MDETFREMELLSRSLNQAHRSAIQSGLNAAGLGAVGHPMLLTILESGDADREQQCRAQRELADLLHISPAAVASSLKSLEKSGYIRREPGQKDARRNRVSLTEKGSRAVSGCREVFRRVSGQMMSGFSPDELRQLAQFQRRMLDNLRSPNPDSQAKE